MAAAGGREGGVGAGVQWYRLSAEEDKKVLAMDTGHRTTLWTDLMPQNCNLTMVKTIVMLYIFYHNF